LCLGALDDFGAIPWSRPIMEIRLLCTRAANRPDQVEAEADLAKLLATEVSFQVDAPASPSAAPSVPSTAPPKAAPLDEDPGPDGG